ncbi:MAG: aerotaxis receptor Aer [Sulfurimonas sp. RIFOXYD12_FULL_33_39]|uniref:PAS domain-containing protein n=1 Tax=unclassified Sulfurimonas TaxID=2623549 RepID=UPI0008D75497|nr:MULTISPECIES: PAS domain-containing protein [unclassified Sulfurimonas]OHE06920.1 MAG: aerotaxis receptor Aer [Sulfurimonas sp. RIFCSPLOWO2_12_FULL_34_6]OHE10506.1 MAG: aerotaxis receptor Aer [Sulfurimonas sp. RIFOXYD12_FULL_33_39]OHE14965.1 MAG: aerotaxis receptor Aer [Sulfurimonas sp. RIFOXYD2_FULL_34_21]DAB28255.1 MAG TPA: aerotaxis receptor Aer [Sulfurimonas sp. UBA10385]
MSLVVAVDEEYIFEGKIAISQTNLEGNITFVNRKFCEISGYNVDELIGNSHGIVEHPGNKNLSFEKIYESVKSNKVWSGTLKNLRKDGRYYWIDMEIIPIIDEEGQITGYISVSKPSHRKNINDYEKSNQ